jgi:3-hydroxyacyl-CoA dehydrogenase/enoyl-CoA hydratase/3-hydroxybutyryl-CoA epimerase
MSSPTQGERIVQRIGRPYVIEAVRMLEAGEGSVDGIDGSLVTAGYRSGPFQQLDDVGLDVDLAIDQELHARFELSDRFAPPALQSALVGEGRLGRSVGRGFYRYDPGLEPLPDVTTEPTRTLAPDAVVERLELGAINEAYRVVEEGLASPPMVDEAMRAHGFPCGPFERVDQLGLRVIVDRLHTIYSLTEERSDDQYAVAAALWQIATA